ncbi:hypothetical protein RSAG8_00679, partial [Rhizoctonia solani AG-8 WAC10335]
MPTWQELTPAVLQKLKHSQCLDFRKSISMPALYRRGGPEIFRWWFSKVVHTEERCGLSAN